MHFLATMLLTVPFFTITAFALKSSLQFYCKGRERAAAMEITTQSLLKHKELKGRYYCFKTVLLKSQNGKTSRNSRTVLHLKGGI